MSKIRRLAISTCVVALVGAFGLAPAASAQVATASRSGASISARLTKTSFTSAQSTRVKLIYSFSATSRHFAYLLTIRKGSKWQTVKRYTKTGTFRGSKSMTVKQLFAPRAVTIGMYRLRLTVDSGSKLLGFKVIKALSAASKPRSGNWNSTALSGSVGGNQVTITGVSFSVGSDQATVAGFTYHYTYSAPANPPSASCSGDASSWINASSPITSGQFSSPSSTGSWGQSGPVSLSGPFHGTFDSETSVHGTTSSFTYFLGGSCSMQSGFGGPFKWTATWQPA